MTTEAKKKLAWVLGIVLFLLIAFAVVYFKYIKPKADKKREEERLAETKIVTGAQVPVTDLISFTESTRAKPSDTNIVVDGEAGIGGVMPV